MRWGGDDPRFGPVLLGLEDRWDEAVALMRRLGAGDARGVLAHPDVPGRIDVIWRTSDGRKGLSVLAREHPEVMGDLPLRLARAQVYSQSENRIRLRDADGWHAVIRLDYGDDQGVAPKTWLLTAYGKRGPGDDTTVSAAPSDQARSPDQPAPGEDIAENLGSVEDAADRNATDASEDLLQFMLLDEAGAPLDAAGVARVATRGDALVARFEGCVIP